MSCVTRCVSSLLLFSLWVTHTSSDNLYYNIYNQRLERQPQAVPTVKLNSGYDMPMLGLGTWRMWKLDACNAVREAIRIGYRHIDTSVIYGNLKEIGVAICSAIADGIVRREDLFITCKLWATFHHPNLVEEGLDNTLNALGLDYCDLLIMHTPFSLKPGKKLYPKDENGLPANDDVDPLDTWLSMEELVQKKKCRSIGLANFNRTEAERILYCCTIKPAVMQNECHPWLNQEDLRQWCESKGITLIAYSPLGSPFRPTASPDDPILTENPLIVKIAECYKKPPASIILRFNIQRGVVVIPKSKNPCRLRCNFEIFDFELSRRAMDAIRCLEKGFPDGFANYDLFEMFKGNVWYPYWDRF